MRVPTTATLDQSTCTLTTLMLVQTSCGRDDQPHTKWTKKRGLDSRNLLGIFRLVPLSIIGAVPIMEGATAFDQNRIGQGMLLSMGGMAFEALVILLGRYQLSGPRE